MYNMGVKFYIIIKVAPATLNVQMVVVNAQMQFASAQLVPPLLQWKI